jgi:hypothetical protein
MHKLFLAALLALSTAAAALPVVANADSLDRRVTLINNSHETIREFHASNVDRQSWEEDILGRSVLPPGHQVVINLNDGTGHCNFDFLTVMEDGEKVIKHHINVCRVSD